MLPLKIALRFLASNKGQTILIIIGIAIGVSVQVFVGSLIGSLQKNIIDRTIGNSAHITIASATDYPLMFEWQDIVDEIVVLEGIQSVSVAADSAAFIDYAGNTAPVLFRGLDLEPAEGIYGLSEAIYEGSLPDQHWQVAVGKELREELGLRLDDTFSVVTSNASRYDVTVAGFYDLGIASVNSAWVISSLETAQDIFAFEDAVTSIEIQVEDVFEADTIALTIEHTLSNRGIEVTNWEDQNGELLSGLQAQSISSYMIQTFVLVSVVIAIASILAIKVVQKSRQLGILKAMGITDWAASQIFLLEGFFLGLGGAIIGVGIGLLLLLGFSFGSRNPDGSDLLTLYLDFRFIALSGVVAVLAATMAAVLPARKSSRLSPIEVIRNA